MKLPFQCRVVQQFATDFFSCEILGTFVANNYKYILFCGQKRTVRILGIFTLMVETRRTQAVHFCLHLYSRKQTQLKLGAKNLANTLHKNADLLLLYIFDY